MVWINILLNEGDLIKSLNAIHIPIQKNRINDVKILNEKLVNKGYSLFFVSGESYLVELTPIESKYFYRQAIRYIQEHSNVSGYFEGEIVTIEVNQNFWNVKIPNLIYNSIFFNIRQKQPTLRIDLSKKRVYSPNSNNEEGLKIKIFKVDESNFAVSLDYFKSIPSFKESDPSKLLNPKLRKEKIEEITSLIFNDLKKFKFYLGGNNLSIPLKGMNL